MPFGRKRSPLAVRALRYSPPPYQDARHEDALAGEAIASVAARAAVLIVMVLYTVVGSGSHSFGLLASMISRMRSFTLKSMNIAPGFPEGGV